MPSDLNQNVRGTIEFGPFRLRSAERQIERSGAPVRLGGRAMDILIALAERAGDVVSHRELIDRAWPNLTVEEANLRFQIAALRKTLGDGQDGARYVINVPGRGYSLVSPTTRSTTGASPLSLEGAIHGLPSLRKRMVGRDAAVQAIAAQLASQRFVTIVGPGGIGKTTVAVSIGHAVAADYRGVCFVDLGPLAEPRLVPSLVATALGFVVQSNNLIASLIGFLRDKRMLLILDGCEHVIETVAALAEAIYEQAEGIHILTTSREALRIEGEHVHRLSSLECPPMGDMLAAAESLAFPAAQLFSDRLSANSDGLAIRDYDAAVVARICRKLDGIPLAIELAAARVTAHGIEGVDAMLDSTLSLLWQGRRTASPRHQTLNAALDWSYDLLVENERAILRRLAVFAGSFSLEAVQALARDGGAEAGEIAEVVANLVAKSLIESDAGGGRGVRYRLLDTTRTYLRAKMADAGEADAVARRHAEFFCKLLERISAQVPAHSETPGLSPCSEHLGNVRSALEWGFSERGDVVLGVALAAAAAPLFLEMSQLTECRYWTERALAAHAASGNIRREMELQASLGMSLMFTEGNSAAALRTLKRAMELSERLGELSSQLRLIGSLHLFHTRIADFRGSVGLAERARDVAVKMGDPSGLAVAEWMLGVSHHLAGDQSNALIHCWSAIARPAVSMHPDVMRFGFDHRVRALCALTRAQWLRGHADEAADTARYTVREAEAHAHQVTLCISLIYTMFVFLWRGDWSEAEANVERLISETERHSLHPYYAVALGLRGELAMRQGEAAAAIPMLLGCLQALRSERHEVLTAVFTSDLAEAMAMTGRLDEALVTMDAAVSEVEGRGGSFTLPEMLRLKGDLLLKGESATAVEVENCFRRSLDLARRQGALGWELRSATSMARLRASQGRRAEAREELASVFGRFTQGKETVDLRAAGKLLKALG
jgi:predicted ATPase/DNA-binding winged helix-turn-helix (wHTH) protein